MSCVTHPLQHFLEWIMSDALEEHDRKVSIGDRNITNLRFADGTDALAEEEQELEALVESLEKLGTVTSFKYLGAVVSDKGSKPEVLSSRIAQASAALTKLKPI